MVVVDLQRDFLDESLQSPFARWEKAYCVPSVNRLLSHARGQGWRIVHVGTRHRSVETLPFLHHLRGDAPYCLEGSPGCEFVVSPEEDDICLYKHWYSAFDASLDDHVSAGDTVVWAGVSTDCCIQASAFDADRRQLRSVVPIEAVSASSCESFSASLTGLGKSVATIVSINTLLAGMDMADSNTQISDVGERAEEWFKGQQERLGTPEPGTELSVILQRLEDP